MYHKDAFGRLFCNVALDKKISGGGKIKREF